jgi:uncharacterized membrane protein
MNQHTISRIAIYVLAIVLIIFGVYHFMQPQNMVIWVPDWLPGGSVWVYLVGAAFIATGLSFLSNKMVKYSGYALAILLFLFVITIHLPNYLNGGDPELRQVAFINLLKDVALAAFALYIASNADYRKNLTELD